MTEARRNRALLTGRVFMGNGGGRRMARGLAQSASEASIAEGQRSRSHGRRTLLLCGMTMKIGLSLNNWESPAQCGSLAPSTWRPGLHKQD